jgi:hypothetical protein
MRKIDVWYALGANMDFLFALQPALRHPQGSIWMLVAERSLPGPGDRAGNLPVHRFLEADGGFELHGLLLGDLDGFAGLGVSTFLCRPGYPGKDPDAEQGKPAPGLDFIHQEVGQGVHGLLRRFQGDGCAVRDDLDDFLFRHAHGTGSPF